jgi:peptide/nickel transport system permease protein
MLPTLLLTSIIAFSILRLIPADPAIAMLGETATESRLEEVRESMGLNKSLQEQYFIWIGKALQGDLGMSIFQKAPVTEILLARLETTGLLSSMAAIIILLIAIPLGVIAAKNANTWVDQSLSSAAMFFAAVPAFWLGLTLMLIFSLWLGILPTSGFPSIARTGDWGNLRYLILPAVTVAIPNTALVVRMTRSSMLDIVNDDYVRTARAKGLSLNTVYVKHVLPNALNSIISSFGFILASLISGSVVTENIFSLPGIGQLLITSIGQRDYPVIQGVILFIAVIFMLVNLMVDIAYAIIDPRIRYS